ncbi:class I SAM-dependent methyltransferase [Microbaculum sp. FT89]|uniref:class I SAM-dependent methyltransferase n=1 Tax=Microbaculum sp. FT89 TaxID=3447298 RepID=UPI003F539100
MTATSAQGETSLEAEIDRRLAGYEARDETATPVTDAIFSRVPASAVAELMERLEPDQRANLERLQRVAPQHFKRRVMQLGTELDVPGMDRSGLLRLMVPETVHSVVGANQPAGDFFACDMFADVLAAAGVSIPSGGRLLDFGASSGRVVRNLALYYPEVACEGCDPRKSTSEWAEANIPSVRFYASPVMPPLPVPDGYYDAVYAGSVWSHFSERSALAWFAEMRRAIAPGGVLVFTTHGYVSVRHFRRKAAMPVAEAQAALEGIDAGRYVFNRYPEKAHDRDLDNENWGISYIPRAWMDARIGTDWDVLVFQQGRLHLNQDVYVLRRVPDAERGKRRRRRLFGRLLGR